MKIARPLRLLAFVAACTAVLFLALAPASAIPEVGVTDKVEHALAFTVLAMLGLWAFPGRVGRLAAGLIAFGIMIEILQATMPFGRDGEVLDVVADTFGVSLGMTAQLLLLHWARRS